MMWTPADQPKGGLQHRESTLVKHLAQFEKVLCASSDTKMLLEENNDAVSRDVNLKSADHRKLVDQVEEVKSGLLTIGPIVSELQAMRWRRPAYTAGTPS
ncbi:hypothetical protein NDU88_003561 [Pleurodeles waltl]|uniref:Uncharacterized protein n=1 Tax=Pleurodeles waltl TaxID=8319 RepID=A0AAV7VDN4_PLEWA|nr:hypothetical protein NDU88_003561 [Pleurodeles waltl]